MIFLGHKVKDQHQKLATSFDQENGPNHLHNHIVLTKRQLISKYRYYKKSTINFAIIKAEDKKPSSMNASK